MNEINTYRNKYIILVSSLESSSPSKTEYQEIIDYVTTNHRELKVEFKDDKKSAWKSKNNIYI